MNVQLAKEYYNYVVYQDRIHRIKRLATSGQVIINTGNRVLAALTWRRGGRYGAYDTGDLEMWKLNPGFRFATDNEIARTRDELKKKIEFDEGDLKTFSYECKLVMTQEPNDLPPINPLNVKCVDMGQGVIYASLMSERNLQGAEQLTRYAEEGLLGDYTIYDTSDIQDPDFKKFFEENWAELSEFENYVHNGRINKLFITRKGEKPTVKKLKDVRHSDK
jgi:hypothetical protein